MRQITKRQLTLAAAVVTLTIFLFTKRMDDLQMNFVSIHLVQMLLQGKDSALTIDQLGKLDPEDKGHLRLLAIAQSVQGDYTKAEITLSKYHKLASPQAIAIVAKVISNYAAQLAARGEVKRADLTVRLLAAFSDDAAVFIKLADLYQSLGKTSEAEAYLLQSIEAHPSAEAYLRLGELQADQGVILVKTDYYAGTRKLTLAREFFQIAMRLDPNARIYANYRLGDIFIKLGSSQDSIKAYNLAAQEGKRSRDHHAFLSFFYLGQIYSVWWTEHLDYALARGYFENACEIAVDGHERAMCLSGIAQSYLSEGKIELAIVYYRQAVNDDPAYEVAVKALRTLENNR